MPSSNNQAGRLESHPVRRPVMRLASERIPNGTTRLSPATLKLKRHI